MGAYIAVPLRSRQSIAANAINGDVKGRKAASELSWGKYRDSRTAYFAFVASLRLYDSACRRRSKFTTAPHCFLSKKIGDDLLLAGMGIPLPFPL